MNWLAFVIAGLPFALLIGMALALDLSARRERERKDREALRQRLVKLCDYKERVP